MTDYELIKQIQQLKRIEPSAQFRVMLRGELSKLESPNRVPAFGFIFSKRMAISSIALALLLVAAAGNIGDAPVTGGPVATVEDARLAGLNNEEILDEMGVSNDINISLNEIAYHDSAGQKINMALNQVSEPDKPY